MALHSWPSKVLFTTVSEDLLALYSHNLNQCGWRTMPKPFSSSAARQRDVPLDFTRRVVSEQQKPAKFKKENKK